MAEGLSRADNVLSSYRVICAFELSAMKLSYEGRPRKGVALSAVAESTAG